MADAQLVHLDRKSSVEITVDASATIRWTVKGEPQDFLGTTARYDSAHYPQRALVAIPDYAAFVRGATRIDERVMQWTAGDAQALYREAIRFGDRVMFAWGRNNARDLQTIGITTTEAAAIALVESFRQQPLKGFKATTPYFVEGRGGISREYTSPSSTKQQIGNCIDTRIEWRTYTTDWESHVEELPTVEAAGRRYDELELAHYAAGGRPREIEWMKTLRHLADYTLLEHIGYRRHADDAAAFARAVLAAAGIASTELPTDGSLIYRAVAAIPEASWVRVGERVGTLERKPGSKPNTELVLDTTLGVVATITRNKKGEVTKVAVKRAKTPEAARAQFDAAS